MPDLGDFSTLGSMVVALIALFISLKAQKSLQRVMATQVYLDLRSRFLEIFLKLGDLDRPAANSEERAARFAYWHHSFDEWYIGKSAPKEFGALKSFYRDAGQSGLGHASLRQSLDELANDKSAGFGRYAQDFISEILRVADVEKAAQDRRVRSQIGADLGTERQ